MLPASLELAASFWLAQDVATVPIVTSELRRPELSSSLDSFTTSVVSSIAINLYVPSTILAGIVPCTETVFVIPISIPVIDEDPIRWSKSESIVSVER